MFRVANKTRFANKLVHANGYRFSIATGLHPATAEFIDRIREGAGPKAGIVNSYAGIHEIDQFVREVHNTLDWSQFICWPMRERHNAGTGTTLYSLGGLGTFDGTLVNGPTWGDRGIYTDGIDDHIQIADCIGGGALTVFHRLKVLPSSPTRALLGQYDSPYQRSFFVGIAGDTSRLRIARSGNGVNAEFYNLPQYPANEFTFTAQWVQGKPAEDGGIVVDYNGAPQTLTSDGGTPQTNRLNSAVPYYIGRIAGTSYSQAIHGFNAVIQEDITEAQKSIVYSALQGLVQS